MKRLLILTTATVLFLAVGGVITIAVSFFVGHWFPRLQYPLFMAGNLYYALIAWLGLREHDRTTRHARASLG